MFYVCVFTAMLMKYTLVCDNIGMSVMCQIKRLSSPTVFVFLLFQGTDVWTVLQESDIQGWRVSVTRH